MTAEGRYRISPLAGPEQLRDQLIEAERAGDPPQSLFIEHHGYRFRLDGPTSEKAQQGAEWSDFTETAYAALIDMAKQRYRFATFGERTADRHVLWRHDLDTSVHRALRLADIEHDRGVVATYLFALRLPYYNLLEPAVAASARRILALGHHAGLHFDASAYAEEDWTLERLETRLAEERDLLAGILGSPIDAVSFHDPTAGNLLRFDQPELAGMRNAYGRGLRDGYGYCSDSNGYWRFAPIAEVIVAGAHDRVQVLTHPEWWTSEAMPPRRRIERAILGRARAAMHGYDDHLARSGRRNIG